MTDSNFRLCMFGLWIYSLVGGATAATWLEKQPYPNAYSLWRLPGVYAVTIGWPLIWFYWTIRVLVSKFHL